MFRSKNHSLYEELGDSQLERENNQWISAPLQQKLTYTLDTTEKKCQQRNRGCIEEPNRNFKTKKCKKQIKTSKNELTAERRGQRKESVNINTEQYKLLNINNREKIY